MRWSIALAGASICVASLSARQAGPQTAKAVAGSEYAASPTLRRWFGSGYRDLWTQPFEAPVLDLGAEAGGLQPVRQVGGLQTAGLAMRGADGRSYTFRSLHKEPERLLPAEWRNSWPAKLLRDATSATDPGAGVMLPVLAEAAGIPHTRPRLVVMPDDPRLGEFRAKFANQVGTFEEYPTPAANGHDGFAGATEIISTAELWKRWLQGPDNAIDSRALLRARVLDLFVDNYDRRRGQWRWMRAPGKPGWEPLPEDPDMVFVRHNGLVAASMRARQPRLLEFSDRFPSSLEGPTSIAAEVDRWLLSDLEEPAYEQIALELQAAWTDDVIDRTVAQLPKEWQTVDGGFLARAMRARRAALVPYVQEFYRHLARRVAIYLTDKDERVEISTAADGTTTISAATPDGGRPYYTRRFRPSETREIRVYLAGGHDRVVRTGRTRIHVRVIGNGGEKVVESPDARTEVWTDAGSAIGNRVKHAGSWQNPQPTADAPWIVPRDYGKLTLWDPVVGYAADFGVVVGASLTRTTYGFRSVPWAKQQTLRGGWSFGAGSGGIEYHGQFRRPASELGYDVRALASGIEQVNFFGFGDDTPSQPRTRYHIHQTVLNVAPAVRIGQTSRSSLTIGPEFRYSDSGKRTGTVLYELQPYGIGQFGSMDVRTRFEFDSRKDTMPSLIAVALGEASGAAPDLPRGRAFRVLGSAYVAPPVMDVATTYGAIDGYIAGYAGGRSLQIAARVGGQRVFGDHPWFDAAFIGGLNDRGYHSHRFAGDSSLYANAELRTYLGRPVFESIFPVRFGLLGFVDTGRVWLKGEDSNAWHPSGGGGLLLKPVGTSIVLRALLAASSEGTLVYAGSGFRF
jgi:hypothetical protein